MPDDRLKSADAEKKLPQPEVYIVRNGEAVFKPGMKTWFVETREDESSTGSGTVYGQSGVIVGGTVCSCNLICTCNSQCSCQSTGGRNTYTVCRCIPVRIT